MSPDEAVADVAREAMKILHKVQEQKTEVSLPGVIDAVVQGLTLVRQRLLEDSRTQDSDTRAHALREARASAAGALALFALLPGVEDLPVPRLHS